MKTKKLTIGILIASVLIIICIVVPFITAVDDAEQSNTMQDTDANTESELMPPSAESEDANREENLFSGEVLAYIDSFDGTVVAFDRIEWITVPGERAAEFNITLDDAPNGYWIYNESVMVEKLSIAENCVCRILDWTDNFMPIDVTVEELVRILDERKSPWTAYHLMIENNEVVEIMEQYEP